MVAILFHTRCLLLFFILIQSISLYKIDISDENHPDLSSSSFNEELNQSREEKNTGYESDDEDMSLNKIDKDTFDEWKSKSKRSISYYGKQPTAERRNNRPHWNPLVAAYKRCGEFISREEREICFKDAVQMLFVHKLRK